MVNVRWSSTDSPNGAASKFSDARAAPPLARNRGFESISLQRGVRCEPARASTSSPMSWLWLRRTSRLRQYGSRPPGTWRLVDRSVCGNAKPFLESDMRALLACLIGAVSVVAGVFGRIHFIS
jgi:hypothetical protein